MAMYLLITKQKCLHIPNEKKQTATQRKIPKIPQTSALPGTTPHVPGKHLNVLGQCSRLSFPKAVKVTRTYGPVPSAVCYL